MGEEKRHEMMETLFGAESDDSDDDEDPEALERPASVYSDDDDEAEGGGQVDAERVGSDLEKDESDVERAESEAEESNGEHSYGGNIALEHRTLAGRLENRQQDQDSDGDQSYGDERDGAELFKSGFAEHRGVHQRGKKTVVDDNYSDDEIGQDNFDASERRKFKPDDSVSMSEKSHGHDLDEEENEVEQYHRDQAAEDEEEEVEQAHQQSERGHVRKGFGGSAEMRDVFGDSDEDEQEPTIRGHTSRVQNEMSPSEDEGSTQGGLRPEDIVPDEELPDDYYGTDDEQPADLQAQEKPVGPPLHIDIPFYPPPGHPDKMHVVRVSNIMGIEPRLFDPKTYIEEEEQFITDESGHKQRIRLEDNIARWRFIRNRDGFISHESNARFVKWSDGSMQLLIGNEVLDISIQKAHQDQAHLFLHHNKGILQSQGRLLQKMKFMPSSLSSKSHRLLTALVDSRNRKIYKVKNVITNKDPEREKEEAERLQEQRIRSKEDLQRKQEKISRKYLPVRERVEPQLSPGYLEGALEEDEADDYGHNHNTRRFQERLDEEDRAERRIMNAKRQSAPQEHKRYKERQPVLSKRHEEEQDYEEAPSEYESDDQYDMQGQELEGDEELLEHDEEEEDERKMGGWNDDDDEEPYDKRKDRDESDNEASPPRKAVQRRRVVVSESDED